MPMDWTDGEDKYMAIHRGEMPWDRPAEPEEPARPRVLTSRERAHARLGKPDCLICEGEHCWCGVAERLRDLVCGHAGDGVCRWCLAEFLVLGERELVRTATWRARTLVAAKRLRQWRQRRGAA
jgi:hypothetical protein